MSTLVLFYSYSGRAKALAQGYAKEKAADIAEIKDIRRPGVFKAYTSGCFAAIKGRAWPIQPLEAALEQYSDLVLFAPVWAGNPPPAVNAALEQLPGNKTVSAHMVSGSGRSSCKKRLADLIAAKGSKLDDFINIKAAKA
jgi:flavodoxin